MSIKSHFTTSEASEASKLRLFSNQKWAKKIYFSDYSTDQYLKYNKSLKKTYFEQLIIKYWKKEQTSIIGAKKIMREYFINYNFQDKSITNSILFVIYSLFLNKCYFLFLKYLLKFIIWKIIK